MLTRVRSYKLWWYDNKKHDRSFFYHTTSKTDFNEHVAFCEENDFEYYFETETFWL